MYHPASNPGVRREPNDSSRQALPSSVQGISRALSTSSSTAPCKFEMLRPQGADSADFGVAAEWNFDQRAIRSDEPDPKIYVPSEQRLSVDNLLSAVQKSLMAHGEGAGDFKVDHTSDNDVDSEVDANRPSSEILESTRSITDAAKSFGRSQQSDVLTRADPSSSVSLRSFKRRSLSSAVVLPDDHLKHVHEEIFSALRQKMHTVTMIFGFLNSRAPDDRSLARSRPSSGAHSTGKNSIRKDDFKAAVSLLGLGLSEEDVLAVYDYNSDIRTGELTFNNLQRAIKSISFAPSTAQATSIPRSVLNVLHFRSTGFQFFVDHAMSRAATGACVCSDRHLHGF